MQSHFTKLVASILLGVFSVFLIPNEFVHALYGHKDTKENVCPLGTSAISKHHIHCDFLSYDASLFNSESSISCPQSFDHQFAFSTFDFEKIFQTSSLFPSLRGPPQLV